MNSTLEVSRAGAHFEHGARGGLILEESLWLVVLPTVGQQLFINQIAQITTGVEIRSASFSADGTRVAYSKGRRVANVWRIPILGDRLATWSDAEPITHDEAFVEFIDVSPDGSELAVSSDRLGNPDLWILPSSGGRDAIADHGSHARLAARLLARRHPDRVLRLPEWQS